MNSESNKLHDIQSERIVHKNKDLSFLRSELADLGEDEDLYDFEDDADDDLELDWDDVEDIEDADVEYLDD